MNTRIKFWLYDNHVWMILLAVFAIIVIWLSFSTSLTLESLAALVALPLGLSYFLLKQQLEETRLFQELFQDFNMRYGKMNEDLSRMLGRSEPLTQQECAQLSDYFNLCAEECLYYARGYIPPKVWEAWLNGMKVYFEDERIREFWCHDATSQSHYGLAEYIKKKFKNCDPSCVCRDKKYAVSMSRAA
jgi:hypothetical protein